MTLNIWWPTFLKSVFYILTVGISCILVYETKGNCLNFNIIEKNLKIFWYFIQIWPLEVNVWPLDIETNNFRIQIKDTYNWNFMGFSISNDRKLTIFSYSDKKVWDFWRFQYEKGPGSWQNDSRFLDEFFSIPK